MKFIPKKDRTKCSCRNEDYNPDTMIYIGYQIIDDKGNGFPLFNCPNCGTTIVGGTEGSDDV